MKAMIRTVTFPIRCILTVAITASVAPGAEGPIITSGQIEADWLLQDVVRMLPAAPNGGSGTSITTRQDAAGGCDGIKDGTYGFHTDQGERPWWQVDLGESLPLDRVV